eukprot:CAMPEP_0194771078 /NCGR_PEP_ID=MMETSP0323_2-20130528/48199_1 /TAXON_ID=2866 ORGANISM="Crypthecodinium cohnii, Strain Seligo" /NCGR_SAMPLE_ID=MMETSP0323_2 /ASSEMBLY_ACC=CAM_ASM_000346 /LENGTH=102 /DNA_ID=CAMNT_0039705001 /DNA_START=76 /DNA_END=384 /DNA_ORIENTATION=+
MSSEAQPALLSSRVPGPAGVDQSTVSTPLCQRIVELPSAGKQGHDHLEVVQESSGAPKLGSAGQEQLRKCTRGSREEAVPVVTRQGVAIRWRGMPANLGGKR